MKGQKDSAERNNKCFWKVDLVNNLSQKKIKGENVVNAIYLL